MNLHFTLTLAGKEYDIYLEKSNATTTKVEVNGVTVDCVLTPLQGGATRVEVGGQTFIVDIEGKVLHVDQMPVEFQVRDVKTLGGPGAGGKGGAGEFKLKPPMPGKIVGIKVNEGDAVKKGQILVVLEAMKMQNELPAPRDGTVKTINVKVGQTVEGKDVLVVLE